ncbi:MAG TPA: cytochrome P450 [Candidatus Saccharimonadales bacterium]|nr:cytochrome P450 [Candidatus Saccharimonadales bacterium]
MAGENVILDPSTALTAPEVLDLGVSRPVPDVFYGAAYDGGDPLTGCPHARTPAGDEVVIIRGRNDVMAVLAHTAFSLAEVPEEAALTGATLQGEYGLLRRDRPDITGVRRLMAPYMRAQALETYQPGLEAAAREAVNFVQRRFDQASATGHGIDLAEFVRVFLPQAATATFGLTEAEWGDIRDYSAETLSPVTSPARMTSMRDSWQGLYDYTQALIENKSQQPDGLLLSNMIAGLKEGGIEGQELVQTVASFLDGIPTIEAIFTVCLAELLQHPQAIQACLDDPARWEATVAELLRHKAHFTFASPRIAREDITLPSGIRIKAGQVVVASLTAALDDQSQLGEDYDPHAFDPDAPASRILAFGAGSHRCPADELSTLWLCIGLKELFTTIPDISLHSPLPPYHGSALPTPFVVPAIRGRDLAGVAK